MQLEICGHDKISVLIILLVDARAVYTLKTQAPQEKTINLE